MRTTPPPETERKQGRGTGWVFIEMSCAFLAVVGVNMKLADGRVKKERLTHYNDVFQFQVERKWETKEWVDQHGVVHPLEGGLVWIQKSKDIGSLVYYASIKRGLKRRLIYEYRFDERLKTKNKTLCL